MYTTRINSDSKEKGGTGELVKIQVRPDTLEEIASSFARAKEDSKKGFKI